MNEAKLDAKLDTTRDPPLAPRGTRAVVRGHSGPVAGRTTSCCGPAACTTAGTLGYSAADQAAVPDGANLGLGCGNPTAIASLRPGETVLDLGAGGGFDCFLAARQVGPTGKVIGVDMTAEMVTLARGNARKAQATNVDFRLGEIEHLPVADATVDVILSNCVINLSPEKPQVFREVLRVLKPGGRMLVSDLVLTRPLAPELQRSIDCYVGCVAGGSPKQEYLDPITPAGFAEGAVGGPDVGSALLHPRHAL